MSNVLRLKAKLAREELRHENVSIAEQIRALEVKHFTYWSSEAVNYRKILQRRATALAMATALVNCRLHAKFIENNGFIYYFSGLIDQADFLFAMATTPYSILKESQKRLILDVVNDYDSFNSTANVRFDEKNTKQNTKEAKKRQEERDRKREEWVDKLISKSKEKQKENKPSRVIFDDIHDPEPIDIVSADYEYNHHKE